jgi:chromate transporter
VAAVGDRRRVFWRDDLAGSRGRVLFIGAGILGILYYGSLFRGGKAPTFMRALAPVGIGTTHAPTASILGQLFAFFLKAGSLTFGSGLVIVPFLEKGLVQQYGWLNRREFLVAVAVGMLSPGPVVITATFVGFLVAGFWGSLISTIGIFLPSFILILVVAPILVRHRGNPNVQGFVKGPTPRRSARSSGRACYLARSRSVTG